MKSCVSVLTTLMFAACAAPAADVDSEYRAEIEAWRASRLERLTADDGWLTVVGLHWLRDGFNRIGSNPGYEVPLQADGLPPLVGTLSIEDDGRVFLRTLPNAEARVNGEPALEAILKTDAQGPPDVVDVGRFRLFIIDRDGRLAVRVKDRNAPARRDFKGIEYFPIDPNFRVTARFEAYDTPTEVQIPTVVGTPTTMLAPGLLHFSIGGDGLSLEPYLEDVAHESYFVIFRDRTSGTTSYGGGRYLSIPSAGDDGTTVIDFNRAYNPPCVFTDHATCPLPTARNSLPIAIEAGERYESPQ
jgi:uncharacterized protein (DUF1684 family)